MPRTYNVVSPHLDDAALSCALFLAAHPGCRLITVFTAGPASVSPLTTWDRAARYFKDGADVMAVRRGEDAQAAALVGATALHLPYWDRQYRNEQYGYDGLDEAELAPAIAADLRAHAAAEAATQADQMTQAAQVTQAPQVTEASQVTEADQVTQADQAAEQARPWLIPLGLGHPDHRLATDAALLCVTQLRATQLRATQLRATQPRATQLRATEPTPPSSTRPAARPATEPAEVYVYADLPYAVEDPAGVGERKRYLAERGFALAEDGTLEFATDRRLKAAVLRCHTSQRRVLRRRARTATRTPERIWRLVPMADREEKYV